MIEVTLMEQGLNPSAVGITSAMTYLESRGSVMDLYAKAREDEPAASQGTPDWVEG